MPPSRPSFPLVSLYREIKARVATYRHGWFKVLVWFLFAAMTVALSPGMVAIWFWRLSHRPAPGGGRRVSMLLLAALTGFLQLLWLYALIIDPMAGIGEAQNQPPEPAAAGATPTTAETVGLVEVEPPTTTDSPRVEGEAEEPSVATATTALTAARSAPVTTTTTGVEPAAPQPETTTTTAAPATTTTSSVPSSTAPAEQPVAAEGTTAVLALAEEGDGGVAYDRDLYGSWTLVRSGCNTRCAVLEEERRSDGTWLSWYDGRVISDSSQLDIDHMVPLAEAHSSGAWQWGSSRKRDFANDLAHPQALAAVSASSNRSKGSRDPSGWRPSQRSAWCRYATDWVTVKTAWGLTADEAEARALEEMLDTCDAEVTITTTPAPVTTTTTPTTTTFAPTVDVSCPYNSAAGDPCAAVPALANQTNDVNCGDIPDRFKPLTVAGRDYDRLDGNSDGAACTG